MTGSRRTWSIADPDAASGRRVVHFQEYWVRLRAEVPAESVVFVGLDDAAPGPGVIDAIIDADLVIVPPSNPVVSVGTILGVPRVREALTATRARVVGLSPIVGGTHVRGMAQQMLTSIGVEVSAAGVGLHYGSRHDGGVLDGWLVDETDADLVDRVSAAGLPCRAVPLMMTDPEATAAMAAAAITLVTPMTGRQLSVLAPDGVPEIGAGDDLVGAPCSTSSTSRTATSSSSPARWSARPRAGCARAPASTPSPRRPCAWSPGAVPPRSCGPATA